MCTRPGSIRGTTPQSTQPGHVHLPRPGGHKVLGPPDSAQLAGAHPAHYGRQRARGKEPANPGSSWPQPGPLARFEVDHLLSSAMDEENARQVRRESLHVLHVLDHAIILLRRVLPPDPLYLRRVW